VGRVLGFAVPAGTVAAATTFAAYALARATPGTTAGEARTAATFALFSVGMAVLFILAWPPSPLRIALFTAMVATFGVINSLPWSRSFFALSIPSPVVAFATVGVSALGCAGLMVGWAIAALVRRRYQLKERVYPRHRGVFKSS
jgi:cation-transporting ATPase E